MLKKTVTYTDYNGEEQTEDFYFNLTKAELIELEVKHKGYLTEGINDAIEANDGTAIMAYFKDILSRAYGVKSEDGKRFRKTTDMSEAFLESPAYSEIFMEIITHPEYAANFVKGIAPVQLSEDEIKSAMKKAEEKFAENDSE